ncbi:hypothetical protein HanRHA438_Chr02g0086461 [Helianthus annuus]|nr:hypothetical protein HanRHA438_Chr02g0086461 [Helianthus annuus]
MDGVNEPAGNGKISNLLDLDAKKQTFGRKSQNWSNNLTEENCILLFVISHKSHSTFFAYKNTTLSVFSRKVTKPFSLSIYLGIKLV